jgi:hypothetical protein
MDQMTRRRIWAVGALTALGIALAVVAPSWARDEQRLARRGKVDGKVEIYVRRKQVRIDLKNGKGVENQHYDFSRELPARDVRVYLRDRNGRGSINIFQQPNSGNDYTAGVRVDDPEAGSGSYRFELAWSDNGGSGGGHGGGGGNGGGGHGGNYGPNEQTAISKAQDAVRTFILTYRSGSRDVRFDARPSCEYRGSNLYRTQGGGTYSNSHRFTYRADTEVVRGTTSGIQVKD